MTNKKVISAKENVILLIYCVLCASIFIVLTFSIILDSSKKHPKVDQRYTAILYTPDK